MVDIRTQGAPESVNDAIRDRTIRHLLWLTRLATQQANEITRFLESEVIPDLEAQLRRRLERINERGFDTGPQATRRLEILIAALHEIASGGIQEARRRLEENLAEIGQSEAEWQVGVIQQSVPVHLEMVLPAAVQIKQAILERPFDGMPLSGWFDALEQSTQRNLERAIRQGIVEGEALQRIVQRIRGTRANGFTDGVLGTTTRQAQAIARTAIIHANTQARMETLQANADIVKSLMWTSSLDSRTCPTCAGRDGRTYPLDSGPRPPAHTQCRCTLSPVLKSWRELGIDADEMEPSTRASMNGQVPGDITYGEWLRSRVNAGDMEIVEEALGATRAKLFAAGGLKVEQFTDRRGRVLTLKELRQREAAAFRAAGINP